MNAVNAWTTTLLKKDWLFFGPLRRCRDERMSRIAVQLADELKKEKRIDIGKVQKHPKVLTARKFFKDLTVENPRIAECRKQLLALKLGIDAEAFAFNPGFQKFAAKNYLERYLMEYQHTLSVDPATKKISLMANGAMTLWDPKMDQPPAPKKSDWPKQPWVYGMQGVQSEDMFDWSVLKPYKMGNPADWGKRYVFEFCACCTGSPQKTGDHSWFRLKTPAGEIYSVGLYRPGKAGTIDNLNFPLRIKRGYLMQPDVSEFWPCDIQTISVEITQSQFLEMKKVVEQDKKEDKQTFQLMQANCVLYTKKIAKIAGIELPTDISVARLFTNRRIEPLMDKLSRVLPKFVVKVCAAVAAFFWNLVQLALGASRVDKAVKAKNGAATEAHFAKFSDIFKMAKSRIHHPNTLGHRTRQWVEKWRQQEIAKLEKLRSLATDTTEWDKRIEDIKYRLPPKSVEWVY